MLEKNLVIYIDTFTFKACNWLVCICFYFLYLANDFLIWIKYFYAYNHQKIGNQSNIGIIVIARINLEKYKFHIFSQNFEPWLELL